MLVKQSPDSAVIWRSDIVFTQNSQVTIDRGELELSRGLWGLIRLCSAFCRSPVLGRRRLAVAMTRASGLASPSVGISGIMNSILPFQRALSRTTGTTARRSAVLRWATAGRRFGKGNCFNWYHLVSGGVD